MSFYSITALINVISSLVLGLFVYLKNKKSLVNRLFLFFCLAIVVWSCSYFFWQISTREKTALFWSRALMVGAIFIPVSYFHFTLIFLNKIKKNRGLLIFGYLVFSFFLLSNFTPFFVKEVKPKMNFPFWPHPGVLYHPFLLIWFFYAFLSIYLLFKESSVSTGMQRSRLRYILVGTIIGYLGGATNYFLWYDIPIPPLGNWTASLYLAIVAYAIVKYRLLEIKVVLTEFLVAVITLILFIQILVAEPFWLKILNFGVFLLFLIFAYLLIRSVLREIEYRESLQKAYGELKRVDEAKSEFLSMASHQLRTPLSAIKGYISLILEGIYGKAPKKMKKPLENVFASNERLIRIVEDLLNISRIEMGRIEMEKEKVQIEDLIEEMYDETRIKAEEKNLYFKWERPKSPLPKLEIDPLKIKQVILNVVDNAIRYTQKGGVEINVKCQMSNVKISVKDTGEGLTKEETSKLFESFSRGSAGLKFWTEGAGLGLYTAKKFLELHNGRIWAESPGRGKGSTFYIELPVK